MSTAGDGLLFSLEAIVGSFLGCVRQVFVGCGEAASWNVGAVLLGWALVSVFWSFLCCFLKVLRGAAIGARRINLSLSEFCFGWHVEKDLD